MKHQFLSVFLILFFSQAFAQEVQKATFAGGCFWCMEPPFEKLEGVKSVISGYAGGELKSPTYQQVSSGKTKHLEVVQITFDPKTINYNQLLEVFWRNVNPTDSGGQFVDRGPQYQTAIFYHSDEQRGLAEASKLKLEKSHIFSKPIVTPVRKYENFYAAEDYHQDYYKKNPVRYKLYRYNSGRDQFIEKTWKGKKMETETEKTGFVKPTKDELKKKLTPIQFKVTQKDGTEPPFKNEYWDNKKAGIYVDIVSGEPLFSSTHKYKSGTGWPSFYQPLENTNIVEKDDRKLFVTRTEVRSKNGDSHLGHVFQDGPEPTGLRYCINSASLRFIPVEDLEKEGYGKYKKLFEK